MFYKRVMVILGCVCIALGISTGCSNTNKASSNEVQSSTQAATVAEQTQTEPEIIYVQAENVSVTIDDFNDGTDLEPEYIPPEMGMGEYRGDDYYNNPKGWRYKNGRYKYFDRNSGRRLFDTTVDGIEIDESGEVVTNDSLVIDRLDVMMKAHRVVDSVTAPDDSMEVKREKVFRWIMSFPYKLHRELNRIYDSEPNVEVIFANDMFDKGSGDCVSEASAVALLFHEIGYEDVYWCHDSGHSWVDLDGRLYDPLFAESRDFNANYNAEYNRTDFRTRPLRKKKIY